MSQKTLFNKTALAVAVAIVSTSAWSAGFQLNEFSSSGLGRAYSGEGAIADDAGNASRNPALIMMFDRPTFSAGAIFVDPGVDISGRSPTGADLKSDNIAPTAWVPNMHFVAPINDQFGWGASVTSNYGLATEFNNDYAAGAFGGKTDLETLNLNLSGAYRLDNHWSFGVGFDAVDDDMLSEVTGVSPGSTLEGNILVAVPQDTTTLTVAYQETYEDGSDADAYFVDLSL